MSTELKNCPFCGSDSIGFDFNHSCCWHYCENCLTSGPSDEETESDSVKRWNTRAGQEWQPIETAPKDGSKILLYGRCGGLDDYHDYDPTVELGKFWDGSIEGFEDGLWAPISSCPHDLVIDATHWMPLPKAPGVVE